MAWQSEGKLVAKGYCGSWCHLQVLSARLHLFFPTLFLLQLVSNNMTSYYYADNYVYYFLIFPS